MKLQQTIRFWNAFFVLTLTVGLAGCSGSSDSGVTANIEGEGGAGEGSGSTPTVTTAVSVGRQPLCRGPRAPRFFRS